MRACRAMGQRHEVMRLELKASSAIGSDSVEAVEAESAEEMCLIVLVAFVQQAAGQLGSEPDRLHQLSCSVG